MVFEKKNSFFFFRLRTQKAKQQTTFNAMNPIMYNQWYYSRITFWLVFLLWSCAYSSLEIQFGSHKLKKNNNNDNTTVELHLYRYFFIVNEINGLLKIVKYISSTSWHTRNQRFTFIHLFIFSTLWNSLFLNQLVANLYKILMTSYQDCCLLFVYSYNFWKRKTPNKISLKYNPISFQAWIN